jgi:hypothetical protein
MTKPDGARVSSAAQMMVGLNLRLKSDMKISQIDFVASVAWSAAESIVSTQGPLDENQKAAFLRLVSSAIDANNATILVQDESRH